MFVRRGFLPRVETFAPPWTELWPSLPTLALRGAGHFPAVNVWDAGEELVAEAELPGITSDDLEITVVGDELTLKGRRPDRAVEGESFHRRERMAGSFTRVLRLPVEVDSERVQATLRDGVLTLQLPKHAATKPRKIVVQSR